MYIYIYICIDNRDQDHEISAQEKSKLLDVRGSIPGWFESIISSNNYRVPELEELRWIHRYTFYRLGHGDAEGFVSNLHRHGLIFFRIAMILSAVRNIDNLNKQDSLICNPVDFSLAGQLMKTLYARPLVSLLIFLYFRA